MLTKEEMVLEQYKHYSEQKDKFVARNFATNKFYFVSYQ